MSLYYQDESVTLYHGNSLTDHREWLDADVLLTDPPYGSQLLSPGNGNAGGYGRRYVHSRGRVGAVIAGDESTESRDLALELWGDKPLAFFASARMPEPPGDWEDRIVWDKRRPGMNAGPFRYIHEMIYARGMVRADNSTFSIISMLPNQKDHIHAKPIELMSVLVKVCPPGVIADPFSGSGSTLVAAKALGRNAVGVELEEKHCETIAKRLSQGVLDIFGAA
jgi:site-specific DNA-methyltransferase (adenine-specific)